MSGSARLTTDTDRKGQAAADRRAAIARGHRWRRIIWTAVALCCVITAVMTGLADHYQPLDTDASRLVVENYHFPGMPAGLRPRPVNAFGNMAGEMYLVPQRGVMTLSVLVRNNGPMAVTIESVTISPQLPLAGKPRYLDVFPSVNTGFSAVRGPVAGLSLAPGHTIVIGIPLHVPACVNKTATPYETADSFLVKERFLEFTHVAAIPLDTPLIWQPGFASPTARATCAK